MAREWTTGLFKEPVLGPVWVSRQGLSGDGQADRKHHGGPEKAVCVYPARHYPAWREELGLSSLGPGAFGENFSISGLAGSGLDEETACIGDLYQVGAALLQISQPRQPCWKIARRWGVKDLALRVQRSGRTGWYLRVLQEGLVERGQPLALVERPFPALTVLLANQVLHERLGGEAASALAACPLLTEGWRTALQDRIERGIERDPRPRLVGPNEEA